jgi:hypothetical protein
MIIILGAMPRLFGAARLTGCDPQEKEQYLRKQKKVDPGENEDA